MMPLQPNLPIDVFVGFGHERGSKNPHWMLMLCSRDSDYGNVIHITGGPTQYEPFKVTIQRQKRVATQDIKSTEFLSTFTARYLKKVAAGASQVSPQQFQQYVFAIVTELEARAPFPAGRAERLARRVIGLMAALAKGFQRAHPVAEPSNSSDPPEGSPSVQTDGVSPIPQRYHLYEMRVIWGEPRSSTQRPTQVQQEQQDHDYCCIILGSSFALSALTISVQCLQITSGAVLVWWFVLLWSALLGITA